MSRPSSSYQDVIYQRAQQDKFVSAAENLRGLLGGQEAYEEWIDNNLPEWFTWQDGAGLINRAIQEIENGRNAVSPGAGNG